MHESDDFIPKETMDSLQNQKDSLKMEMSVEALNIQKSSNFKETESLDDITRFPSISLSRSKRFVSKSQTLNTLQNVFTESQKIAYVSLCYLLIVNHKNKRIDYKRAVELYELWSGNFMEKLFVYLDITPQERKMVETLAQHGLCSEDIVKGILQEIANQQAEEPRDSETSSTEEDIRYAMLAHLYILCISDGHFDSRSRALFKKMALEMKVPFFEVIKLEKSIADELRLHEYSDKVQHEDQAIDDRNKLEGRNRWLFAGLSAVAGGAVIGLTAGLAAPFIGAGIVSALGSMGVTGAGVAGVSAFMSGAGGIAAITTTGVLTGGGMGGVKMMKRTRGIEEFEFLAIADAMELIKENKAKRKLAREAEQLKPNAVMAVEEQKRQEEAIKKTEALNSPSSNSNNLAPPQVLWEVASADGEDEVHSKDANLVIEKLAGAGSSSTLHSDEIAFDEDLQAERKQSLVSLESLRNDSKQTNVLITIAGWVNHDRDDHTYPFSTIAQGIHGDQYTMVWETEVLKELGSMLSILVGEVASFIIQQGIQATLLPVLMAALTAPLWAIKLTYLVDNPWGNALTKAEKAGRLLADNLIAQVQANRPVSLLGFSLGARVIYYCLLELAQREAFGIVEDVYFLGMPVISSATELDLVTSVVAGRIVNGYSTNDQLLGVLYRASSALWSDVPGLRPILSHNVENVDLTELLNGHMDYYEKMPVILEKLGFEITSEVFFDQNAEIELEKKEAEKLAEEQKLKEQAETSKDADHDEFWKPREIPSNLPALVLDELSPRELPSNMPPLVLDELNIKELPCTMPPLDISPRELPLTMPALILDAREEK